MLAICDAIDGWVRRLATAAAVLVVAIALVQISVSVLRYFYSYALIGMQELVLSMNVMLVSAAICYALLRDVHTRVDIFTQNLRVQGRIKVELALVVVLLLPTTIFLAGITWPYVWSAWATREGSRNVGGLGGIYIIKSFLLLMALTLSAQALSIVVRSLLVREWPYPQASGESADC